MFYSSDAEDIEEFNKYENRDETDPLAPTTPRILEHYPKSREGKMERSRLKHPLRPPCNCSKLKCHEKLSQFERVSIYNKFWDLDKTEQRMWMARFFTEEPVKRPLSNFHRVGNVRRCVRKFYFMNETGRVRVCQRFFLNTLGFINDSVLNHVLTKDGDVNPDRRGRHAGSSKIDTVPIDNHILSYLPEIQRETPRKAYYFLPHSLNARQMYRDYLNTHSKKVSEHFYRTRVHELKISFHGRSRYRYTDKITVNGFINDNSITTKLSNEE